MSIGDRMYRHYRQRRFRTDRADYIRFYGIAEGMGGEKYTMAGKSE